MTCKLWSLINYFIFFFPIGLQTYAVSNSDTAYLLQVHKPLNQVLSSMVDQDVGQVENHNLSADELQQTYSVEEFEIRILEPEKSGGPWQTRATIAMHSSENALTIRVVTLLVSSFAFLFFFFLVIPGDPLHHKFLLFDQDRVW